MSVLGQAQTRSSGRQALRDTFTVMGTVASLVMIADQDDFAAASRSVRSVLGDADRRFSPFRSDSELSRMRRGEVTPQTGSGEMREVLDCCELMAAATDGAFRPRTAAGALDTTGYVKGWAIQRAGAGLVRLGLVNWVINVGGDVLANGSRGVRPWRVAIQHPRHRLRVAAIVSLPGGGAVATSGNAQRGEHVWRADGQAVYREGSCSVVGPRIDVADSLATAFWALGTADSDLVARFPDYRVIFSDGLGGLAA